MTPVNPFRSRYTPAAAEPAAVVPTEILAAEKCCLGAAILDNTSLDVAMSGLSAQHFSLQAHRELFAVMLQWRTAGQRFTPERLHGAMPHWPVAGLRELAGHAQLQGSGTSALVRNDPALLGKSDPLGQPAKRAEDGSPRREPWESVRGKAVAPNGGVRIV